MNFDTTKGEPYTRIDEVTILYPAEGTVSVMYSEREAIRLRDGSVRFLDTPPVRHAMAIDLDLAVPIQICHPQTGEDIPGQTTTLQALMLGITAVLRRDQKRRAVS